MKNAGKCVVICGFLGLILAMVLVSGCSVQPTKLIRITEYAAESPLTSAATVGGCSVESTEESPVVFMSYEGNKCRMEYGQ